MQPTNYKWWMHNARAKSSIITIEFHLFMKLPRGSKPFSSYSPMQDPRHFSYHVPSDNISIAIPGSDCGYIIIIL